MPFDEDFQVYTDNVLRNETLEKRSLMYQDLEEQELRSFEEMKLEYGKYSTADDPTGAPFLSYSLQVRLAYL